MFGVVKSYGLLGERVRDKVEGLWYEEKINQMVTFGSREFRLFLTYIIRVIKLI